MSHCPEREAALCNQCKETLTTDPRGWCLECIYDPGMKRFKETKEVTNQHSYKFRCQECGTTLEEPPRNERIAELWASGLSQKEIAARFKIGDETVRRVLYRKFESEIVDKYERVSRVRKVTA